MGYKYKNMMLLRFNTAGINLGVNAIFKISDGVDLKRVGVERIPLFWTSAHRPGCFGRIFRTA